MLELLWFLQWWSQTERGLSALIKAMVAAFPDRFVTREMTQAGPPANDGEYSSAQCFAIWKNTFDRRGFERVRLTRADDAPLSDDFEEWIISNFPYKLTVAQWPTAAPSSTESQARSTPAPAPVLFQTATPQPTPQHKCAWTTKHPAHQRHTNIRR